MRKGRWALDGGEMGVVRWRSLMMKGREMDVREMMVVKTMVQPIWSLHWRGMVAAAGDLEVLLGMDRKWIGFCVHRGR
ncbi:hypothetical protein MRB53_016373 [Persea americana]|uniref:Uncharacterized protein n=1 Tax=Persea americana TaxID=3435 RepID=A0ACC2M275_PERAE|nr:hypothetical protein MRB53_016373 [Persea americana]